MPTKNPYEPSVYKNPSTDSTSVSASIGKGVLRGLIGGTIFGVILDVVVCLAIWKFFDTSPYNPPPTPAEIFGYGNLIVFPILTAIIGMIMGAIVGGIYGLIKANRTQR